MNMKFWHIIRLIVSISALCLVVLGFILFMWNMSVSTGSTGYGSSEELPIDDVQGVIVTDEAIYIGLGNYSRIQKYTLDGEFVSAERTYTHGKDFTFKVDEYGTPKVANKHVDRNNSHTLYESELLDDETKEFLKELNNYDQVIRPKEFTTQDGVRYYVNDGFKKSLIKIENGKTMVLKEQDFFTNMYAGSLVPWLTGLLGLMLFYDANILLLPEILEKGDGQLKIDVLLKVVFSVR